MIRRENETPIRVTEKAFHSVYADKGFDLITRDMIAHMAAAPLRPAPGASMETGGAASIAASLGMTGEDGGADPNAAGGAVGPGNFTDAIGADDLPKGKNEINANPKIEISEERKPAGRDRTRTK
jgi:hypothetical protein